MNKNEAGKFMLWMMAIFPQWKPDPAVVKAWAEELPDITADEASNLVRKLQARKPSPFPPSIFQIIAEARPEKLPAEEAWYDILGAFKGRPKPSDPMIEKAVKLMGGWFAIGNSEVDNPFVEKKFKEIWNSLQEAEDVISIQHIGEKRQDRLSEGLRQIDRTVAK